MSSEKDRSDAPQSVTRVIRILEALATRAEPVGLADLSRMLGTPKSSLAALLRGLVKHDFVTVSDGVYQLGPGAFGLGSALLAARRQLQSSDLVREGMRRLAAATGETVLFAVRDAEAQTITYVDVIESRNAVRFSVSVGDRRPLYCTASGRVLLAASGDREVAAYLGALEAEPLTEATETDPDRLIEIIAAARVEGVAQTVDQAAEGVTGTAAVIRDSDGTPLGALVCAAPTSRSGDRQAALADMVRAEAGAISRSLGHRGA